ncbi:MAG: hypothetical protein Q8872_02795 [Candidatus Phytoplasma australasiaticum]|nr:hypothetical protein [Candidatus Phytoplasma australasiaticum]
MSDALTEIYRGTYFQDRSNLKKTINKKEKSNDQKSINQKNR